MRGMMIDDATRARMDACARARRRAFTEEMRATVVFGAFAVWQGVGACLCLDILRSPIVSAPVFGAWLAAGYVLLPRGARWARRSGVAAPSGTADRTGGGGTCAAR